MYLPIQPFAKESIETIISNLAVLINRERSKNGISGNDIKIIPILRDFVGKTIPYTLIEKKSAWDILQDIANLCCAHVYVNRQGVIIIERDRFDNSLPEASGVKIDMSNAFTYSLPVSSKNVVNQVSIEYSYLGDEKNTTVDNQTEEKVIKKEDLIVEKDKNAYGNELTTGKIYFIINLDKVYESINAVKMQNEVLNDMFSIHEANFNFIRCCLTGNVDMIEMQFGEKQPVDINVLIGKKTWKLEKRIVLRNDLENIVKHGVKEFNCKANPLMTKEVADINANKILGKYANGISYLESNWTGDSRLEIGKSFLGDKEGENEIRKTFECLSNEITIGSNFRQKTKGMEVK